MGTITGYIVGSCLFENAESATFSILGDSMKPLLKEGQKVSLRPLEKEERLISGNLYAFRRGPNLVLHRLICYRKGSYLFVGDNRMSPELVERCEVVGRCEIPAESDSTPSLSRPLALQPIRLLLEETPIHVKEQVEFSYWRIL